VSSLLALVSRHNRQKVFQGFSSTKQTGQSHLMVVTCLNRNSKKMKFEAVSLKAAPKKSGYSRFRGSATRCGFWIRCFGADIRNRIIFQPAFPQW
jgi:hypothetical protein